MARILFTVTPAAGHLHPTVPIALALQARGHDARYCTGLSKVAMLEGKGLPATATPTTRCKSTGRSATFST
jgi:UDP:flavonoid glycosyltransferase YjiC (YdhE family)